MTPTQRSLAQLRSMGMHAQVVEHWNPFAHVRVDLFGFADIIAFRAGQPGSVLVQTTSGGNASARRKKILANPLARDWIMAGNWIRLDRWAQRGARGQRKTWSAASEYITADKFQET